METWVKSDRIYDGAIVGVCVGDVRLDDGMTAFREVVEHPGGVGVVPMHGDAVILVRQYRIAIGEDVLEIPAGKLEGPENPLERGHAELEEETGYRAGRMVSAGSYYASVGYSSEEYHLFLAFDLEEVGQRLESDERIEIVHVPLDDIERILAANELKDAKTVVALEALLRYQRTHPTC
ncbi:MAG: NUDIX domain-containing protein [Nitrospiraceae bacterium]|nr:NUDIX domain-containing protein [Nitrospiraceae bacterium]